MLSERPGVRNHLDRSPLDEQRPFCHRSAGPDATRLMLIDELVDLAEATSTGRRTGVGVGQIAEQLVQDSAARATPPATYTLGRGRLR